MKKMIIAAAGLAVFLSGCAIVGGGRPSEESGELVWTVWGSNENWAFNNADKLCPHGYIMRDERANRPLPPLHLMEIECRPESSRQVDLVLRPREEKPYNPDGIGLGGQYSYEIGTMPAVKACNAQPNALLERKAPGVEVYGVACTNGSELKVQCTYSICEVVR